MNYVEFQITADLDFGEYGIKADAYQFTFRSNRIYDMGRNGRALSGDMAFLAFMMARKNEGDSSQFKRIRARRRTVTISDWEEIFDE